MKLSNKTNFSTIKNINHSTSKKQKEIITEMNRIVKFYELVIKTQFEKLLLHLNFGDNNNSTFYFQTLAKIIQKIFSIDKIIFILKKSPVQIYCYQIQESIVKNKILETSNIKKIIQKCDKELEINKFSKILIDDEDLINCKDKNYEALGIKKEQIFLDQVQNKVMTYILIQKEKTPFIDFKDTQNFTNASKFLNLFLEAFYIEQFYNLYFFKNMQMFVDDFFQTFFYEIDYYILTRVFSFLNKQLNIQFSLNNQIQNIENKDKNIFLVQKNQLGYTEYQIKPTSANQNEYRQIIKQLKIYSNKLIQFKINMLHQLQLFQSYELYQNELIFIFNENSQLIYSNKIPKIFFRMLQKKQILQQKEILLKNFFSSDFLKNKSFKIFDQMVQNQVMFCTFESCKLAYQINLDQITKLPKGFTLIINKDLFLKLEIENYEPETLKNIKQIQIGNRILELKNQRKKKKVFFNKDMKMSTAIQEQVNNQKSFEIKINSISFEDYQKSKENLERNNLNNKPSFNTENYSQISEDSSEEYPCCQMIKPQMDVYSPVLDRSLSFNRKSQQTDVENILSNNENEKKISVTKNSSSFKSPQKLHRNFNSFVNSQLKEIYIDKTKIISLQQEFNSQKEFLNNWNFDVPMNDNEYLLAICMKIFDPYLEFLEIPENKFLNFFQKCGFYYEKNNNPFHNLKHGVMVCYSTNYIMNNTWYKKILNEEQQFAYCIAAFCHDLDHTGANNNFEINSGSNLALRYSDKSPLEYHHLYRLFKLAQDPEIDLFKNVKDFKFIREFIIEAIVATDMKFHFDHLENFQILKKNGFKKKEKKNIFCIGGILLHATDLSHTTKISQISEKWARLVSLEFSNVYKQEQELNLPLTSFYKDLDIDSVFYKSEMNFLTFIIKPLYEVVDQIAKLDLEENDNLKEQKIYEKILKQIDNNIQYYKENHQKALELEKEQTSVSENNQFQKQLDCSMK